MKRFLAMLLMALALCAGNALAQADGAASTAVRASLYDTPREGGAVDVAQPLLRVEQRAVQVQRDDPEGGRHGAASS